MAIEDIIWAKNRHMFGGIAPSNMVRFDAVAIGKDVMILGTAPKNTTINGSVVCTVGGVIIRRKADGYPENEFDGQLVDCAWNEDTRSVVAGDTIQAGQSMYYAAFPYSKMGVYNRNKANRCVVNPQTSRKGTYLFGYDLNTTNEDPEDRVIYPSDVDNYGWSAATLNNLGSWGAVNPGEKFMPQPCMLKYDGTVDYYLDPSDYTKKLDGAASDVANVSYEGNAMMEWPKIYTCRWEEDGIYHFRCSDAPQEDGREWYCWCNYDVNNEEIDHFYTGIYKNVLVTSGAARLKSVSGKNATTGNSFSTDRVNSQANGVGWDVEVVADHLLIQDLLVMMGHSTNTQAIFGVGTNNSSSSKENGRTNASGMFSGSADTTSPVKVFGMEDYWGGINRRMLGLMYNNGKLYVKATKGTKDGSTLTDYGYNTNNLANFAGGHNIPSGIGYIVSMIAYPWGRLPSSITGGSATTYECDYYYAAVDTTSSYVFAFGGFSSSTPTYAGAFHHTFQYDPNAYNTYLGSRLSYKPTKS